MSHGQLIGLECPPESIAALSQHLERFGPVDGGPDWLVAAVWLYAASSEFLATSSTQVLGDGYIARPLAIDRVDDFLRQIRTALPDTASRLMARSSDVVLPEPARPRPPSAPRHCPQPPVLASVVIRVAERGSAEHRIACGLLFDFAEDHALLVATDPSTPAMIVSEDGPLIRRYLSACELIVASEYLERYCG